MRQAAYMLTKAPRPWPRFRFSWVAGSYPVGVMAHLVIFGINCGVGDN